MEEKIAIVVIVGFIVQLLTIIGFFMRLEHRVTAVETLTRILVSRAGLHIRDQDLHQDYFNE